MGKQVKVVSSEVISERPTRGRLANTLVHLCVLACGHTVEWSKAGKAGWQPPLSVLCKACKVSLG